MKNQHEQSRAFDLSAVQYTACATFLYAICAGFRDNYGIMLPYLVEWSGISYSSVSFIIALGQLFFGLMQPVFGFLALRTSARLVLCLGASMMLTGLALIPYSNGMFMLTLSLGILLPAGTAGSSYGLIMSCLNQTLTPHQAHVSSGFVAAGIGFGICILSPVIQSVVSAYGIVKGILLLSVIVSLLIPASLWMTRNLSASRPGQTARPKASLKEIFLPALKHPAYRRITFGFFTCGFHMAMIQTHLFSQLTTFGIPEHAAAYGMSVYGLGVITGGVGSGMACARYRMSRILGVLYGSRCIWVLLLLMPLPVPVLFAVIFMLGATGPATLAPTSGMVHKCFDPARLATLLGFVYFIHQIGAFTSAWAGGLCRSITGSYAGIWYADILLCLLAALACLSIKEAKQE